MIVIKIMGGFGNQLFQYATGRALALHLNTELKLDFDFFDTDEKRKVLRLQHFKLPYSISTKHDSEGIRNKENPILLKKILTKLGLKIPPFHRSSHIIEETVFELFKKKETAQSYYIEGWLGDERYFKDIRDLLSDELNIAFSPESENFKLQSLINSTNSVAVHIRRGDYLKNTYFKTLPVEYYANAMKELKSKLADPHFFFFSDDMDWVKTNFSEVENAHFVENNNKRDTQWSTTGDIEDLMLIKSCKHQIIANSTYSWWGAWLNKNLDKLIYYPGTWFENPLAQKNFRNKQFHSEQLDQNQILMINVTKSFLPPIEEYNAYLTGLWESGWLTNRGTLVKQLETQICTKLNLEHLLFVSNGTIAIQIAIKALELSGEIITTPFSYVATTTSILWENCTPIFCDINPENFCIDADKIENLITPKTTAILATHVYGIPCDVEKIEKLANKHGLKVIYDAAHAFGVKYKNKSIFTYGDISTCSFHATKVFHTVEGGSITCNIPELRKTLFLQHSFGHLGDDYYSVGINAKNSEFHAAMGLCNLKVIDALIAARKKVSDHYDLQLNYTSISKPKVNLDTEYNFAYYPIIFENEQLLLKVKNELHKNEVNTRRYFYPSLNNLPYITSINDCSVSDDISKRVLCLPMYPELPFDDINRISGIINNLV